MILLSEMLKKIRTSANKILNNENEIILEFESYNGDIFKLKRTPHDIDKFFSNTDFLANYEMAFKNEFPFRNLKFTDIITYKIKNDLKKNEHSSLKIEEINEFKFLTCIFFGLHFKIKLQDCVCLPYKLKDIIALELRIPKNCYDNDCKSLIQNNPQAFNPLYHSKICDENFLSFIKLNLLGESSTLNINIKQTNQ